MKDLFKSFTQKQIQLFTILFLSTLFNLALIAVRMNHMGLQLQDVYSTADLSRLRGTTTFLFLVWNLFLAWVPYIIALMIKPIHTRFNKWFITGFTLLLWLIFLPNAPYIITDLFHLKFRTPIPIWYDMMLIVSFAWTGLMLGLLSLKEIQTFIAESINKKLAIAVAYLVIPLCGFGIYLGRYQRWNSWDLFFNPFQLFADIGNTIFNPASSSGNIGMAVVLTVFLVLGYLIIDVLSNSENAA